MATPGSALSPFLILLALQSTLMLCQLKQGHGARPTLDDVAPDLARVRFRPSPQEDPKDVFLLDGSCCYDYHDYTFCLNPLSAPPKSFCAKVCGNILCIFRTPIDGKRRSIDAPGDAGVPSVPTASLDLSDNSDTAGVGSRGCCKCVNTLAFIDMTLEVLVCLTHADDSLTCSFAVCGYRLCFGACAD